MFRALWRNRLGAISVIGALAIPIMLGMTGLVAEYGNTLVVRTDTQRVADAAAYAGGVAYAVANQENDAKAAAARVAQYNNIDPATVTTTYLPISPVNATNSAIKVAINTSVPLVLSRLVGANATQPVAVSALAELGGTAPACVVALATGSSDKVALSGGVKLVAPECAVASDGGVTAPCGVTLTAKSVSYLSPGSVSQSGCTTIKDKNGAALAPSNRSTADPLLASTEVTSLAARVGQSLVTPVAPTAPAAPAGPAGPGVTTVKGFSAGQDYSLSYEPVAGAKARYQSSGIPCVPAHTNGNPTDYSGDWTITCTGATLNIARLNGAAAYRFNVNASSPTTYNFPNGFNNPGNLVAFGPGTFNVNGDLTNNSTLVMGSGGTGVINVNGNFSSGNPLTIGTGGLHVVGNVSLTGPTTFTGPGTEIQVNGNWTNTTSISIRSGAFWIGKDATIGGASSFGAGNVTVAGTLTMSNDGTAKSFAGGGYQVGKDLLVNGRTTFGAGNVTVSGNLSINQPGTFGNGDIRVGKDLTTNSTATFGNGSVTVSGNLTVGQPTTFGNGDFRVGKDLITSSTASFGNGSYSVTGGVSTSGGFIVSFGHGAFAIGQLVANCSSGDHPSVCATATKTSFGADGSGQSSTFALTSGVYVGGGEAAAFGDGSSNSFQSGTTTGASGYSINVGGGGLLTIADMMASNSVFQIGGPLLDAGGGSCVVVGAAATHDIPSYVAAAGSLVLGGGVYTIGQYAWFGANGGGSTGKCPGGSTIGIQAIGVQLDIQGNNVPNSGGSCGGYLLCIGAGYSSVIISPPPCSESDTIRVNGVYKSCKTFRLVIAAATVPLPGGGYNTGGVHFTEGAGMGISGTVYIPHGPIQLDGGASLAEAVEINCLSLIAQTVTLNGGTTTTSSCNTGALSKTAVLVQ